jgi:Cu/Ag efflux protein CusF
MNRPFERLLPAMLLLIPSAVQAHTHMTLMGTVKAIDATHIEVTLKDGKQRSIPLAKNTMFMRGKDMVQADQVKPGIRVVIVLAEDDKTAEHVKIGTEPKKK